MDKQVLVLRGDELIDYLDSKLADYAVKNASSKADGSRMHREESISDPNGSGSDGKGSDDTRTPFQHDRDRIIHSRAFRRLRGKTQVFTATKGDHYRTRLSHSLEVAQMARSVARVFRINEDLTEAIALGHDLGHPPFGHSGERFLHGILSGQRRDIWEFNVGGFKHNLNSLKVVDFFEKYFPDFPGLNLTHWVREGILKHTDLTYDDFGRVWDDTLDLSCLHIETDVPTSLEGQVVAVCDEVAQVTHDLEDAFRAGILHVNDDRLSRVPVYAKAMDMVRRPFDELNRRSRLIRNLLHILVDALIAATEQRLKARLSNAPIAPPIRDKIVEFDDDMHSQVRSLQTVLQEAVYSSYEVSRMDAKGELIIERLFAAYVRRPERLSDYAYRKYNDVAKASGQAITELTRANVSKLRPELQKSKVFIRVVAEHIAGMTDSFAENEYKEIYI